MTDLPSYSDIKGVFATTVDLVKKGATLEAQKMIVELREILLDLKEENISLRERVGELESAQKTQEALRYDGRLYWKETADQAKDGPFCPPCYDSTRKLIRLHYRQGGNDMPSFYICSICTFTT